jgi:hypothetical protein
MAAEDWFERGEVVQVVMVRAQIPVPLEVPEPVNEDCCEVVLGG